MSAATTAIEHSSFPSVSAVEAKEFAKAASLERRQEFENILSHWLTRFRIIAERQLGNREDAEDAVQDAMLSAFTHIARFDGRAKMSTWLTAIVLNAVRMNLRRRPRGRMLSLDWSPVEVSRQYLSFSLIFGLLRKGRRRYPNCTNSSLS